MKHTNLIGVDVSDSSIKVLQLNNEGEIIAYGNGQLQPGVVEQGKIIDKVIFSRALNEVLKRTRPQTLYSEDNPPRSVICLPESKLFTHYLTIPETVKKSELETYIREDAEKIIPFELDELYFDYHVAEEGGERNATFVGVAKTDLDSYVNAFTAANVKPAFVGGELFSLGNALLPSGTLEEDYMIIDIGAHSTTVGIFGVDAIANTSIKIPRGGEYFTRMIAERNALPLEEAEKQKRKSGLNDSSSDSGIPGILRESMVDIIHKVKEAKDFFELKSGNPVRHIILAGGSALLPGIAEYMGKELATETRIADPLSKIKNHEILEKDTPGILFANVIGLALYGVHTDKSRINLLTQYRYQEGVSEKELLKIRDIRSRSDFYYVTYSVYQKGKGILQSVATPFGKRFHVKIKAKLVLTVVLLLGALGFLSWVFITYL